MSLNLSCFDSYNFGKSFPAVRPTPGQLSDDPSAPSVYEPSRFGSFGSRSRAKMLPTIPSAHYHNNTTATTATMVDGVSNRTVPYRPVPSSIVCVLAVFGLVWLAQFFFVFNQFNSYFFLFHYGDSIQLRYFERERVKDTTIKNLKKRLIF